jgi:hypothetical protein
VRIPTILGLAACLATAARPAGATTIVSMSERALARSADAIVVGTVAGIETVGGRDGAINTLVTIEVDARYKGHLGSRVTLKQPGGRLGGRQMWIAGSPRFRTGERQLLFLTAHRDGTARTSALGLGQFALGTHPRTGETMAERRVDAMVLGGRPVRRVPLAKLLRTVRRASRDAGGAVAVPLVTEPAELTTPGLERETVDAFEVMDSPPARWFEPDGGEPVVYRVDPGGDTKLGPSASLAAIDGALAAWTNVTGATIVLERGAGAPASPLSCNGVTQIVFNDPFDEMPSPVGCSGVLALGGYCSGSTSVEVSGLTFYRIVEGNITFNSGFGGCSFWNAANLAEVATHEVGHTIGIGHSSEDDAAAPELKDATMYYRAHFDGRGAAVRADDIDAVRFIYPGPGGGADDDSDADGVADAADNCSRLPNAGQTDSDGDGVGDLCDLCPLAPGADGGQCEPILVSKMTVTRARRGARVVWRGSIAMPADASLDQARAVLVNAGGVLVDTAMGSGLRAEPRHPGPLRYKGGRGRIVLTPRRDGSWAVRVSVRGVDLGTGAVAIISASLAVGDASFSDSLACSRPRGKRFTCRG